MTPVQAATLIATTGWWGAPDFTVNVVHRMLSNEEHLRDAIDAAFKAAEESFYPDPTLLPKLRMARDVLLGSPVAPTA